MGMGLSDLWYENAIIYCLDVETYNDSDGDGVGDFRGLTGKLDYLNGLGVTCIWLMPFFPTPNRDDGYDVADFYGGRSTLRLARGLRRVHAGGQRARHARHHRSGDEPHLERAPVVPGSPRRPGFAATATSTSGARTIPATRATRSSFPASRKASGPSTSRLRPGTCTTSMSFSQT